MPLRRFSGTESPVCLRHGLLFVQPDASAADISAQQMVGSDDYSAGLQSGARDGMSVPLYIHRR